MENDETYERDEVMMDLGYMCGCDRLRIETKDGSNHSITMQTFIKWGNEFLFVHKDTDWEEEDYWIELENFYAKKRKEILTDRDWIKGRDKIRH